jgi:hypothetical protein
MVIRSVCSVRCAANGTLLAVNNSCSPAACNGAAAAACSAILCMLTAAL